jgi:hypothetical protein
MQQRATTSEPTVAPMAKEPVKDPNAEPEIEME